MTEASPPSGPDLTAGIDTAQLPEGEMLVGHVGDEAVLLARRGADVLAIGAVCTHYGGPLGEGLLVGDTVRCPWHHACFSLRTGAPLRPPALNPVDCWRVEQRDGKIFVREKRAAAPVAAPAISADAPRSIVILGGGARRQHRRRNAAARGLCRPPRHDQRRCLDPVRPAEPVEGLPRRQRARGMDPAALARILSRAGDRAASERPRRRRSTGRAAGFSSTAAASTPTTRC